MLSCGKPTQDSQFTCPAFTQCLKENDIRISMDGKGVWRDNVFVERLWRTVKYEQAYLHAYQSSSEAKSKISHYFEFYNQTRPHSKLDRLTPDQFYYNSLSSIEAA
jgi:putative transposase